MIEILLTILSFLMIYAYARAVDIILHRFQPQWDNGWKHFTSRFAIVFPSCILFAWILS